MIAPFWHVDGVDACEYVLSRRQGFSVPGQHAGGPKPDAHPEHLNYITPVESPKWQLTAHPLSLPCTDWVDPSLKN